MRSSTLLRVCFLMILLAWLLASPGVAGAVRPASAVSLQAEVTAFDLILAMNSLRVSNGLAALVEDPIVMAVAQATAETMAANQLSWHIGNVSGRLAAAGYGGGAKVWATENFAVGNMTIDQIMVVWADPDHMIPAVSASYCHVGAGVARSPNGRTYYVLQAAYTSTNSCGPYTYPSGYTPQPGSTSASSVGFGLIVPVKVATPDPDGKLYHVVQSGQSLWAIAIAYHVTIRDLQTWNNLPSGSKLQVGQKLFIPTSNTEGYATPTPPGMIQVAAPDAEGKIIHIVQAYQTLYTIAEAYKIQLNTILALNGIQADWPLQIGQNLVISPGSVTPSATARPLTPVERLTPASDGKYYHIVKSGETLSWIADLYAIPLAELMAWNGLNLTSILQPDQKLLLLVTPPATITFTPGPPTATTTDTPRPPAATITRTPTRATPSPSAPVDASSPAGTGSTTWLLPVSAAAGGLVLVVYLARRRR